jgi:hypothetical protein
VVLLWGCGDAMLRSFDVMLSWERPLLSSRFTGLILIPIAGTAAEVLRPLPSYPVFPPIHAYCFSRIDGSISFCGE